MPSYDRLPKSLSGKYGEQLGCSDCAVGKFNRLEASSTSNDCLSCPHGTYRAQAGGTTCSVCPVGTFSNETSFEACINCAAGDNCAEGEHISQKCPPDRNCCLGTYSYSVDKLTELIDPSYTTAVHTYPDTTTSTPSVYVGIMLGCILLLFGLLIWFATKCYLDRNPDSKLLSLDFLREEHDQTHVSQQAGLQVVISETQSKLLVVGACTYICL